MSKGRALGECRPSMLVLDAGKVLYPDVFEVLWGRVSELATASTEEVKAAYRDQMRVELWTGASTEPKFWEWLIERFELEGSVEAWREYCLSSLTPLAAARHLSAWAQICPLVLLSNHRHEWLRPALERDGLERYFSQVIISSEHQAMKPEPELYRQVEQLVDSPQELLFVDDKSVNLDTAALRGWQTCLADTDGGWVDSVNKLLA